MTASLSRTLNGLGLLALSLVLIAAFADQLLLGELPCPLCLLQRVGFVGCAFGLALNVKFGPRPSHYAVTILSACFGGAVSARQILGHIVPGTGTYGSAVLGLHYYTWALIVFAAIVLGCALMLLLDRQFEGAQAGQGAMTASARPRAATFGLAMLALAAFLALANGVSTVLECGGGLCPDNPVVYELLPGISKPKP
ncbi:disulfide bond formation protein B [Bosea sp. AAP35]|uniref:disulfide bond formation protein B n=1 Tax=Bosea sp. AAP35 TaxID=1523417 RepID=UPI0006B9DE6F|nr:disulfide bond formation protein B [Bosea sp. AAP35]KPF71832.1 disulfide bond formation protein B [Bosea sp. AAP35]